MTRTDSRRCPPSRLAVLCSAMLLALCMGPAQAAAVAPNESLVSPQTDIFDPEFSQERAQITWVDSRGRLWVAAVDRETGLFKPTSGRGVLVDPDALTSTDLVMIGNGPEWLPASGPDRIVYTKFQRGQPHTEENARLAMAERDASGNWRVNLLGRQTRLRPYTSTDIGDPAPRISYIDTEGNAYWREVDKASTETLVPRMEAPRALAMRFVEGQRATVFVAKIGGLSQVVRYWLDSGWVEQLSFDGDHEVTSSPFMWRAPEFDNDYVFAVTALQATELRIYRQLDKANPAWTVVYRASASPGTRLSSVEPFKFDGKSYVFMSGVVPPNDFASAIFLSNIDAAQPMFRQLTPDLPLRTRADPEVFITNTGPYIYYYRADRRDEPPCPCNEGMYRSDTGLRAQ